MRILWNVVFFVLIAFSAFALTLEDAVNLAIQNDDSIKQQKSVSEAQEFNKKAAASPFLPQANLVYNYSDAKQYAPDEATRGSSFGVQLAYNLFNGRRDWLGYQQEHNTLLMQRYMYKATIEDVILSTKTAYITYLKSRNQLAVSRQTLQLLQAQKDTAEVSYEVGTFSRADVLKVDVLLASTRLALLNAQINMKLARQELEKFIGRAITINENVAEVPMRTDYVIPAVAELYEMLETSRSEMLYVKGTYRDAQLTRSAAYGGYMPKIDLEFNYSWYSDNGWPYNDKNNYPYYDRSRSIGLTATWNIFDGLGTTNRYMAASKSVDASAYAVSDLRKSLRLQVSNAYEYYFSAVEMLNVAAVGVEQAQENYRVTQSMYENGEATTTDLLDASVALNDALNSYASANYDIITAVAQVERAVETELLGLTVVMPEDDAF
jgi:outer membrane protein TolC